MNLIKNIPGYTVLVRRSAFVDSGTQMIITPLSILIDKISRLKRWALWKDCLSPGTASYCNEFGLLKFLMRTNITKTFLFYRFNQSMQSLTRHFESFWRRKFSFGLWNSSMEVLLILVRIRIIKSPNSSCLNYY